MCKQFKKDHFFLNDKNDVLNYVLFILINTFYNTSDVNDF